MIKSWATNQSVIALSSGEAEYYAIVKAATNAIGVQSICNDMGISHGGAIRICTDASAAIGIASCIGVGKVRHIEVTQLWVQDRIAKKELELVKVGAGENLADALTKAVNADSIAQHISGINAQVRGDRHALAPAVVQSDSLQYEAEGSDE